MSLPTAPHSLDCFPLEKTRQSPASAKQSIAKQIPPEILSEIFLHCHPLPSPQLVNTFDPHQPPWTLAQVCQAWRQTALSFPSLWSTVNVDLDSEDLSTRRLSDLVAKLTLWLERSASSPLSVFFSDGEDAPASRAVLHILIQHCDRWKYVELDFDLYLPILSSVRGHVPLLESLTLNARRGCSSNIYAFEIAPCLRSVTTNLRSLLLPWHQLVRLTNNKPNILNGHKVLSSACSLRECRLGAAILDRWIERSYPQVVQHCLLQKLEIKQSRYLRHLTLPSLEVLNILDIDPDSAALPDITCLVIRSKCQLRSARIIVMTVVEEDIERFYDVIPRMQNLSLIFAFPNLEMANSFVIPLKLEDTTDEEYLKILPVRQLERQSFLPELHSVSLEFCDTRVSSLANPLDYQHIVEMIESRRPQDLNSAGTKGILDRNFHPLEVVKLVTPRSAKIDELVRLQDLKAGGLDLTVELF